ncbi:MAG: COX15/CtaA family protein [Pseudomonadota bacterium]
MSRTSHSASLRAERSSSAPSKMAYKADMQNAQSIHPTSAPSYVAYWLLGMAVIIAVMVTIGGATRLTDSGLSITEWDLVLGTFPPLSDAAWLIEMEKYRQIPEYQEINKGMSMAAFKEIYWWEWGHRNLGRFIGLAFLIPLLWWSIKGVVSGGLRLRLWGLFALICLQGVIGWYMVASGLSERVDVSQYRLALHLGTAIILFCLILWQAFALLKLPGQAARGQALGRLSQFLLAATFAQVILGAFVAGLRAGKTYNTWPLMDGRFVPNAYFGEPARFADLFERIEAVQFNHRLGAYLLFALTVYYAFQCWRAGVARYGAAVLGMMTAQALIGIWTLVAAVPLWLGLLHQFGALMVLTLMIWAVYDLTPAKGRLGASTQGVADLKTA